MEFFLKWLVFASINAAVVISPGPAFAMTVRNAAAYGRRAGLISVLGLSVGVGGLVALVMGGMGLLLHNSVTLFTILKYCGAAYLLYIGIKALCAGKPVAGAQDESDKAATPYRYITDRRAFMYGFLTNISNPKGYIFFTAIFSQFVTTDMPLWGMGVYIATSMCFEIAWFSFVTLVLTHRRVRAQFMGFARRIEQFCGGLMIALGLKLALSKV